MITVTVIVMILMMIMKVMMMIFIIILIIIILIFIIIIILWRISLGEGVHFAIFQPEWHLKMRALDRPSPSKKKAFTDLLTYTKSNGFCAGNGGCSTWNVWDDDVEERDSWSLADTVSHQYIVTVPLEVEQFAIECLVVRVSPCRTHTWNTTFRWFR